MWPQQHHVLLRLSTRSTLLSLYCWPCNHRHTAHDHVISRLDSSKASSIGAEIVFFTGDLPPILDKTFERTSKNVLISQRVGIHLGCAKATPSRKYKRRPFSVASKSVPTSQRIVCLPDCPACASHALVLWKWLSRHFHLNSTHQCYLLTIIVCKSHTSTVQTTEVHAKSCSDMCCSWLHRLELRKAQAKDGNSGHQPTGKPVLGVCDR